jgi:signal-transduction protein with cAMP-binding, CBS, and nucleotidyltransferase domain
VTRLSSAGLVYVHFGQEIIAQLVAMPVKSEIVQETYKRVYEGFIEEIVMLCLKTVNIFPNLKACFVFLGCNR